MQSNPTSGLVPAATSDSRTTRPGPAHEQVYRSLRDMILFGDLAPGQPVTIQGLSATLDCGITPVREAIRRLTSEGALMFQGNRRVSVPALTPASLAEVTFLRKAIEPELARRAAQRAQPADVARLQATDQALDVAISNGDIRGYLMGNYQFHHQLYALASAPILAETADRLWLRFGPSMRVVCGRLGTGSLHDWHKDILEGLQNNAPEPAAQATLRDLEQGVQQLIEAFGDTSDRADSIDLE